METYSKDFLNEISNQTMVRKIWKNVNSDKEQYSIQMMEQVDGPLATDAGSSMLVNIAQGGNGGQRVTAIFSVSKEQLEKVGVSLPSEDGSHDSYCFEGDGLLAARTVFNDVEVEIQVVENTTKDPNRPSQEPKVNPSTEEVITNNGRPVYRHTSLVPFGQAKNVFLESDRVEEPVQKSEETLERTAQTA